MGSLPNFKKTPSIKKSGVLKSSGTLITPLKLPGIERKKISKKEEEIIECAHW